MKTERRSNPLMLSLCILSGCPGPLSPPPGAEDATDAVGYEVSGIVAAGRPVRGILGVDSLSKDGEVVTKFAATASTDDNGAFSVKVVTPDAVIRLCAFGLLTDAATKSPLRVDELCTLVDLENPPAKVAITPLSHLATRLAFCRARREHLTISEGFASARRDMNAVLGCPSPELDVVEAVPAMMNSTASGSGQAAAIRAGLLGAALSRQAATLAQSLGYTPGRQLTTTQLVSALSADITHDCVFDGTDGGRPVQIEGYTLTSQTMRSGVLGLAQAARQFVESDANLTGLTYDDVRDFVACLSAAPAGNLFADAGQAYDNAAPSIEFDPKNSSAIIDSAVICATVEDASPTTAYFEPFLRDTTWDDGSGVLCATIDGSRFPDGNLGLTVVARDEYGNETQASTNLRISRGGPAVTLALPPQSALRGMVSIPFEILDEDGVAWAKLIKPFEQELLHVGDKWTVALKTYDFVNGPLELHVVAADRRGLRSLAAFPTELDNHVPGAVHLCASLESPIVNGDVSLCHLSSSRCTPMFIGQLTTNSDGCATIPLPTTIAGLMQVRVHGGEFLSATTGEPIGLGDFPGLTATFRYTPTAAGTTIEPLSVNAFTTIGDALAVANGDRTSFEGQYGMLDMLLGEKGGMSINSTYVRDMVGESRFKHQTNDVSTRLGLASTGLAECAREMARHRRGVITAPASSLDFLGALLDDSTNGVFDGLGVSLFDNEFTPASFRGAFARCILNWALGPLNKSGATIGRYGTSGRFLAGIAESTAPLFSTGPIPPAWDIEGPRVTIALDSGATTLTTERVNGLLGVEVHALDISGFRQSANALSVALDDSSAVDVLGSAALQPTDNPTALTVRYSFDTSRLTDGFHAVTAFARDAVENIGAVAHRRFFVDNTGPQLSLTTPQWVRSLPMEVTGSVFDYSGIAAIHIYEGTSLLGIATVTGGVYSAWVSFECNRAVALRAVAVDSLGNTNETKASLMCDNRTPVIDLVSSWAYQESDYSLVPQIDGVLTYWLLPGSDDSPPRRSTSRRRCNRCYFQNTSTA